MKFFEPTTISEAVSLLGEHPDARCISGGATLVAMMNADLVDVPALVSLRRIPDLAGVVQDEVGVRIGAMTTHHAVANAETLVGGLSVVRRAAGQIAHPGVRQMGTMGGSISHADPAADYPGALVAADATIEIAGSSGARQVKAREFFLDYFTTAVEEGELVSAVLLPTPPDSATGVHRKFARVDGDFATVSISLVLALHEGICSHVRIAVGGCSAAPVYVAEAEQILLGSALGEDVIAKAGALLADECDPIDDVRGSAEYRLMLVPRLLREALETAVTELGAGA